jgi:hypothetical protein
MKLRRMLAEADAMGAGIISWRPDGGFWYCFASAAPVPHVARGATGKEALAELVRFLRVTT